MSSWGKYLIGPIVVPTGGWDFSWSSVSTIDVTIPAGSYDNVLYLASTFQDQLQVEVTTASVVISSTGIMTVTIPDMTGADWANTDNGLEAAFGFDGTETPTTSTLESTDSHLWGWYPGVASKGSTGGAGITEDSEWRAEPGGDIRTKDGTGSMSWIASSRKAYMRTLRYSSVKRSEALDRARGPVCFEDRWATKKTYWYLDRSVGAVGSYGTQGDAGAPSYDTDDDCDYYIMKLMKEPNIRELSEPNSMSVELIFNLEPA